MNGLEKHLNTIEEKLGSSEKMPENVKDGLDWHLTKIESLIEGGGSGGDIPEPDEGDEGKVPSVKDDLSGFEYKEKADLVDGKVPSNQLPSYVDDVLEFDDKEHFPVPSERGKIYVALDTGFTYRWSGSEYIQIGGQDLSNFVDLTSAQTITGTKTIKFGKKLRFENQYGSFIDIDTAYYLLSISNGITAKGEIQGYAVTPYNGEGFQRNIGAPANRWYNLYLRGVISDGTNSVSVADISKKPSTSYSLTDGGTITDSTLKSLIQNEQPIKLNGFTCYFSCDDGTNYHYVSTRYDNSANKNHINVITIDKSTWVATFHTSDIALS